MYKQINLNPFYTLYIKINLKCIIDVKIRANITQFLEGTIGEKFFILGLGKDFLGYQLHNA